jgi:flagellar basal body-associated protein FliL
MGKLLPVLLVLIGIGGGGGAGYVLRPAPVEQPASEDGAGSHDTDKKADSHADDGHSEEADVPAYVKLNNQFIVPVVYQDEVSALVVLSLTLETTADATTSLYNQEPKIRDTALRVLFNHAYSGGFDGHFTTPEKLDVLRMNLRDAVNELSGGKVHDVLITDIIRQDT